MPSRLVGKSSQAGNGFVFLGAEGGTIERVLIDRCSLMWATDEACDTWGRVKDLTCQWTILAEGQTTGDHAKGSHSMGWLSGPESDRITIHHCLFAHNGNRNPKLSGGVFEVINNVIYNWGGINATNLKDGARVNLVHNVYVPGPDSAGERGCILIEDAELTAPTRAFVAGNLTALTRTGNEDPWLHVDWDERIAEGKSQRKNPAPVAFRSLKPFPGSDLPRATEPPSAAYDAVLRLSGATRRDAEEERIIREVRERTGKIGKGSDILTRSGRGKSGKGNGMSRSEE